MQHLEDPCLENSFFSPVEGRIELIEQTKGGTILKLKTAWFMRGDIVMPINAEVSTFNHKPIVVDFITAAGNQFSMSITPNRWTRRIPFYLWPGDRARSRASIGFLLLGGEMLLKLSENYTIISEIGDRVNSGKTPLAIIE